MKNTLQVYYGGEKETKDADPSALMERATFGNNGAAQAWPKLLITVSELDPEDMVEMGKDFAKLWQEQRRRRIIHGA